MKELELQDTHHLRAAHTWLELGNHIQAEGELAKIAPPSDTHPQVLELRALICAYAFKWEECLKVASTLVDIAPERPFGWVHRSFALHKLKLNQAAYELLRPARDRFPEHWLICYNLACYACQLGRKQEACRWMEMAFGMGGPNAIKQMALEDPDLKAFWAELPGCNGATDGLGSMPLMEAGRMECLNRAD
ncbi:MAG: hypothetical protein JWR69_4009 [Pedosphaera sp.]|nr:hypothetical protein [Pedosphaera sp.]